MKRITLWALVVVLAGMISCTGNNRKQTTTDDSQAVAVATDAPTYELDSLLQHAGQWIDKPVVVEGYITHTCKHSGKRCFMVGESQQTSFRIEAGGNIGGFNRELIGSKVRVTGTLKENRLTREYIEHAEKEVADKKAAETGSVETCEAELKNIAEMKAWMAANGKDYYSIYYMDGTDYDVVEE